MSFTPTPGATCLLKAAPHSGSVATLPGMNWKLNIDGNLVDVSNFSVGRFPATTLENVELSFTLVWDNTALPCDPAGAGIDVGLDIDVKCFVDATRFYSGRYTVSTVEPGIEGLENVLMYPVTGKIKGTLTRPVP